jgi:hypothetical protein
MPRKPTDIVQYKLRIRETLRRRIAQEAKKRGISANQEMVRRLELSFHREQEKNLADHIVLELEQRRGPLSQRFYEAVEQLDQIARIYKATLQRKNPTSE